MFWNRVSGWACSYVKIVELILFLECQTYLINNKYLTFDFWTTVSYYNNVWSTSENSVVLNYYTYKLPPASLRIFSNKAMNIIWNKIHPKDVLYYVSIISNKRFNAVSRASKYYDYYVNRLFAESQVVFGRQGDTVYLGRGWVPRVGASSRNVWCPC